MTQTTAHIPNITEHQPANNDSPLAWRIWDDVQDYDVASAVARDTELGIEIANGAPATFRIWENAQALIVSRHDAIRPRFAKARQHMEQQGWPIVVRSTGGSAIPHRHGVLHLSMVLARSAAIALSLVDVYQMLCMPIQKVLYELGINSYFSSVQNAFCDGHYNLVTGGKKIAGTAQTWRSNIAQGKRGREGYILAHASLFVDVDSCEITDAVRQFYLMLGEDTQVKPGSIITVRDCLQAHNGSCNDSGSPLIKNIRSRLFSALTNQ